MRGRTVRQQDRYPARGVGQGTGSGGPRVTAMILVAEALRSVFDGGESLATLGPSTVAAVVPRSEQVASKAVQLRRSLEERLSVDRQLQGDVSAPRLQLMRLPVTHQS